MIGREGKGKKERRAQKRKLVNLKLNLKRVMFTVHGYVEKICVTLFCLSNNNRKPAIACENVFWIIFGLKSKKCNFCDSFLKLSRKGGYSLAPP